MRKKKLADDIITDIVLLILTLGVCFLVLCKVLGI